MAQMEFGASSPKDKKKPTPKYMSPSERAALAGAADETGRTDADEGPRKNFKLTTFAEATQLEAMNLEGSDGMAALGESARAARKREKEERRAARQAAATGAAAPGRAPRGGGQFDEDA